MVTNQSKNTTQPIQTKKSQTQNLYLISLLPSIFYLLPFSDLAFSNQTSLSLRQCRSAMIFFFNLSNRWWWVCSLVVFFPPIFEMGLVIGMLNRCGFELVVGYWIDVGLNHLWVWIIYGLLNQCGLLKGCGFELVWAIESVWVWIGCGLLNRCGFESSMGCWISVGCWKGVGLNWSGLLSRYRLVVLVVLGCVRWLRLLWIGVGWLFRFWNFQ